MNSTTVKAPRIIPTRVKREFFDHIGVLPLIATDLIRLLNPIAFPTLALWMPSHNKIQG
jgi:hypothetical protein